VPPGYISATLRDIQEAYAYILTVLHRAGISDTLLSIIAEPVDSFVNHARPDARTYHAVRYMKHFVAGLMWVCIDTEAGMLEDVLTERLFYFNLNTPVFYRFHVARITAKVKVLDSYALKIDRLAYEMKLIRKADVQENIVYDSASRSIKEQLTSWITEEIGYLREVLQCEVPFGGGQEQSFNRDYKLQMNMTIAQLACLLRAFVESGIVQNKNITELAKFLPSIVKIGQLDKFSHESFRMKFYNVESGTQKSVVELLKQLIVTVSRFE